MAKVRHANGVEFTLAPHPRQFKVMLRFVHNGPWLLIYAFGNDVHEVAESVRLAYPQAVQVQVSELYTR